MGPATDLTAGTRTTAVRVDGGGLRCRSALPSVDMVATTAAITTKPVFLVAGATFGVRVGLLGSFLALTANLGPSLQH